MSSAEGEPSVNAAKQSEQTRQSGKDAGSDGDDKINATPFSGGPLYKIQGFVGLLELNRPNVLRRAAWAVAICWLPLALLNAIPGYGGQAFWSDFGAHARYLLVVPLLIFAEGICIPRMSALACNFLNAGVVTQADRPTFLAVLASTQRLLNSVWAEAVVIAAAYLFIAAVFKDHTAHSGPAWALSPGNQAISPAGWWGLLVSLPVLLSLLLSWLWRLSLWTRFLWLVSRFNLRLIPVHPDGAAGLGFIGYSSQAFTVLAIALGTLVAGTIANDVYAGAALMSYQYLVLFFVGGLVMFFNLPLFVFLRHLLQAWRRGTLEYGALADRFGIAFEQKWLEKKQRMDETMLEQQDFSAATDLYQVVDRVYAMWLLPIHPKSVAMLAIAASLPFVPVMLMAVPFDVIVSKVAGLLL